MKRAYDYIGVRFGMLTALSVDVDVIKRAIALCKCDCGKSKHIPLRNLIYKDTKSCGCMRSSRFLTHGLRRTRLYGIWAGIINRCDNQRRQNYYLYGGRGIKVCDEWRSFEVFYKWAVSNGYNDSLSIDRKDTNGNYCPENCRWADDETQRNNKRSNVKITYNGKTLSLAQWSRETGIKYGTLWERHKILKWTPEKTLTEIRRTG